MPERALLCYYCYMSISFYLWMWPALLAFLLLVALGHSDAAWRRRRLLAEISAGLFLAGLPFLAATQFTLLSQIVLGLVQAWGLLLAARLLFGRLPEVFLRRSTLINSIVALALFVVVFDARLLIDTLQIPEVPYGKLLIFGLLLSTVVALGILYQIVWTLKHYRLRHIDNSLRAKDLPTVTLAIPARNETHALQASLQAAVASDYPKLEIIVLDDCSQDKTSAVIRAFAHDGVRFVQGSVPADGWLGKNQAMRTLTEQASGDYIIFAGVDTHLAPQSISKLVAYALSNKLEMVTVLPQRRDRISVATLLASLRYYWQIALPITARRVPVASQAWLIRRSTLKKLGGFEAVQQKIVPESHFARILFVHDQYRFVVSNIDLGITTAKHWTSQIESSVRFLYPTCKRQPYVVLLATLLLTGIMALPFAVLAWMPSDLRLFIPATVAAVLLWLGYGFVVIRTHPHSWVLTWLLFPLSLLQELVLLSVSMFTYEFGDVNWKGRNVCYPVIHTPQNDNFSK